MLYDYIAPTKFKGKTKSYNLVNLSCETMDFPHSAKIKSEIVLYFGNPEKLDEDDYCINLYNLNSMNSGSAFSVLFVLKRLARNIKKKETIIVDPNGLTKKYQSDLEPYFKIVSDINEL